jgi:hypothetical protein
VERNVWRKVRTRLSDEAIVGHHPFRNGYYWVSCPEKSGHLNCRVLFQAGAQQGGFLFGLDRK